MDNIFLPLTLGTALPFHDSGSDPVWLLIVLLRLHRVSFTRGWNNFNTALASTGVAGVCCKFCVRLFSYDEVKISIVDLLWLTGEVPLTKTRFFSYFSPRHIDCWFFFLCYMPTYTPRLTYNPFFGPAESKSHWYTSPRSILNHDPTIGNTP